LAIAGFDVFFINHQVASVADQKLSGLSATQLSKSLEDFSHQHTLAVDSDGQLKVDGQLSLQNGAVLNPSDTPSSPVTGQLYMNRSDNSIYYYDGTKFVALVSKDPTATLTPGSQGGSTSASSAVSSGVMSLQGQAGSLALVSGSGISINGLTIRNSGVTALHAGTGVQVSGLTGDITIALPQDIGQGATPTFNGVVLANALGVGFGGTGAATALAARANLGAASSGANADITSLSGLATALSVGQGGTGVTSLQGNAVLIGNNTGGITSVASAGAGKCLVSTNGAPIFDVCPISGGGVVASGTQTPGRLTKWTNTGALTDSLLSDDGTQLIATADLISQRVTNSTTAFVVKDFMGAALLTADTTTMTLKVVNIEIEGHLTTSSSAPAPTLNTADPHIGSGGTCATVQGNDVAGRITITAGSGAAAGKLCAYDFDSSFASNPHMVISGTDQASAGLMPYATATSASSFDFGVAGVPTSGQSYSFEYLVVQ
jgi:hypothetical protein